MGLALRCRYGENEVLQGREGTRWGITRLHREAASCSGALPEAHFTAPRPAKGRHLHRVPSVPGRGKGNFNRSQKKSPRPVLCSTLALGTGKITKVAGGVLFPLLLAFQWLLACMILRFCIVRTRLKSVLVCMFTASCRPGSSFL